MGHPEDRDGGGIVARERKRADPIAETLRCCFCLSSSSRCRRRFFSFVHRGMKMASLTCARLLARNAGCLRNSINGRLHCASSTFIHITSRDEQRLHCTARTALVPQVMYIVLETRHPNHANLHAARCFVKLCNKTWRIYHDI